MYMIHVEGPLKEAAQGHEVRLSEVAAVRARAADANNLRRNNCNKMVTVVLIDWWPLVKIFVERTKFAIDQRECILSRPSQAAPSGQAWQRCQAWLKRIRVVVTWHADVVTLVDRAGTALSTIGAVAGASSPRLAALAQPPLEKIAVGTLNACRCINTRTTAFVVSWIALAGATGSDVFQHILAVA